MSDLSKKPEPNYAAVYAAALYPQLAKIARQHGYALAVHGSLARDFDLIAVPWTEEAADPEVVVKEFTTAFWIKLRGEENPKQMLHGRIAYFISVGHGDCAIDLSFMPRIINPSNKENS